MCQLSMDAPDDYGHEEKPTEILLFSHEAYSFTRKSPIKVS